MNPYTERDLDSTVVTTRGTDIFDGLLLSQYVESPILRQYCLAFIEELDILFEQTERIYLGRFLEYAEGVQLDVLGEIVGLPRRLNFDELNFGFLYSVMSGTFGTVGDAEEGEVFRSHTPVTTNITTLLDLNYRRVIKAKAMCNGTEFQNVDWMYEVIKTIIGQAPGTLILSVGDPGANPYYPNLITLTIDSLEVDDLSVKLIRAMKPFFIPAGYQFNINLL